ncbi:MAG: hypothetical protein ACOC6Q_01945 [Patescibacteria group bacterium]
MNRIKRILVSLVVVAGVSTAAVLGTTAFFSDTETSTGNVLSAGAIDLKIDNTCRYNGRECICVDNSDNELDGNCYWDLGEPGFGDGEVSESNVCSCTWAMDDLDEHLFFDFADLKPGDYGEDTISLHVDSNDAWACANITLTASQENGITDPEKDEGDDTAGLWGGELDDELNFFFWADDGDNVYQPDETVLMQGPVSDLEQGDGNRGNTYALVDSQNNIWGSVGDPMAASDDYYIGKMWCFGTLTESDDGLNCDGEMVGNLSQTDRVEGNVSFYAVQSRHNEDFTCDSWNPNPESSIEGVVGSWFDSEGTKWADSALEGDFAAGLRFGSNGSWGDRTADDDPTELRIQEAKDEGGLVIASGHRSWIDQQSYDFMVEYNGSNEVILTAGDESITVDDTRIHEPDEGKVSVTAKAAPKGFGGSTAGVYASNLEIKIGTGSWQPISPDAVQAVEDNPDDSGNKVYKWIEISGLDLSAGFKLRGDIEFDWDVLDAEYTGELGLNVDVT